MAGASVILNNKKHARDDYDEDEEPWPAKRIRNARGHSEQF